MDGRDTLAPDAGPCQWRYLCISWRWMQVHIATDTLAQVRAAEGDVGSGTRLQEYRFKDDVQ